MPWIVNEALSQEELAQSFQAMMLEKGILQIPGAHDAMAGLVAKQSGFKSLYLSGAAFTASSVFLI